MTWELRDQHSESVQRGLSTEDIRTGLLRGEVAAEDWVRTSDDDTWKQVAMVDEFSRDVAGTRRRRSGALDEDDALDMTPMIDCTFLLLIFFMITASFHMQKGLDFPPGRDDTKPQPEVAAPGLARFNDRIIIEITEDDVISLKDAHSDVDARPEDDARIAPDRLAAELRRVARETKKTRVLVLAHELASHEAVVTVIDSCGQAGLKDVSLADITSQPLPTGSSNVIQRE